VVGRVVDGNYWAAAYNHLSCHQIPDCATVGNDNYDVEAYPALSRHPGGGECLPLLTALSDSSRTPSNLKVWWAVRQPRRQ